MTASIAGPRGARLTVSHLGLASCLRVGAVAAVVAGVVTFLGAFLLWELLVPGIEQGVGAAFAGSKALLGALLGAGTGLALAAGIGVVTAVAVVLLSVVAPLLYDLAARRTAGIGVVLASEVPAA